MRQCVSLKKMASPSALGPNRIFFRLVLAEHSGGSVCQSLRRRIMVHYYVWPSVFFAFLFLFLSFFSTHRTPTTLFLFLFLKASRRGKVWNDVTVIFFSTENNRSDVVGCPKHAVVGYAPMMLVASTMLLSVVPNHNMRAASPTRRVPNTTACVLPPPLTPPALRAFLTPHRRTANPS